MASKIIQKEKERQESYLDESTNFIYAENELPAEIASHKQSLINLKEYSEEELSLWGDARDWHEEASDWMNGDNGPTEKSNKVTAIHLTQGFEFFDKVMSNLKEDIKELEEMIKKYG